MHIFEIGDLGADELIAAYVALCSEMGIGADQMKMAALELIDAATAPDRIH